MKINFKHIFSVSLLVMSTGLVSCIGDLDVTPKDPNLMTKDKIDANSALNKCYANLALAGNGGASGDSDVDGIDGGTSGFVRQIFNSEELTTDEAICAWGDEGIANFNYNDYDASHPMLRGLYYRLTTGISFCNQYLADFGDNDATKAAEVRFIRALEYYYLLNGWGNVPFSTTISKEKPKRITRADLYAWLVDELKTNVEPALSAPAVKKSTDANYGRVDKAAAWMLLARLYMNANVYTGTPDWANAATYAKKVIDSPYKLYTTSSTQGTKTWSAYQKLFMGDNGESGASVEAIFPLLQDGLKTTSWGTTLFVMASCNDAKVHIKDASVAGNGTTASWGGNRMRRDLVDKFFPNGDAPSVAAYEMPQAANDDRALFDAKDRKLENGEDKTGVHTFTNGYAVCKFNNFKSDGTAGSSSDFPDGDFFLMRSAEAYLMYAEATARANNDTPTAEGIALLNKLRTRAHATPKASYTMREICDEWSREFYFEGLRRTTLIRFGYFGGNNNYNWAWKGGVKAGRNFDSHLNLFAIPTTDLTANSENLVQNPGY